MIQLLNGTKIEKGSKQVSKILRFVRYLNDASQVDATFQNNSAFIDFDDPRIIRVAIGHECL